MIDMSDPKNWLYSCCGYSSDFPRCKENCKGCKHRFPHKLTKSCKTVCPHSPDGWDKGRCIVDERATAKLRREIEKKYQKTLDRKAFKLWWHMQIKTGVFVGIETFAYEAWKAALKMRRP